ncbi:phosphatidate phosphatase PAH2-like isoform X2 [Punica granatum]|uniref:phosphatidate phosphatase n=1 Tax=Punica granatum TaxID=22663 RepID=A0A6P8E2Z5_PUNGR|nr:phosphatidate phosphatase PAH2-like isoform X2 [Punica granatum]
MYAVGRLGSYISRGVYTVSGPFHPFGGAVDIIVVEQPDGSFRSSPWYVRFGKFQGVLKTREKVVRISVNGVDAGFHMYLDHKGEAYFLKEVEGGGEDGESNSYPSSSGDESPDGQSRSAEKSRRPVKSKSFNSDARVSGQVDLGGGKIVARTNSRRARIFGFVFGRRSIKEESFRAGEGGLGPAMGRVDSLERAEIAADLLEVKWSTGLTTKKYRKESTSRFSTGDVPDAKVDEEFRVNDESTGRDSGDVSCSGKMGEGIESQSQKDVESPLEDAVIEMSCLNTQEGVLEIKEKSELTSETVTYYDEYRLGTLGGDVNEKIFNVVDEITAAINEEFDEVGVQERTQLCECETSKESRTERKQSVSFCKSSESLHSVFCGSTEEYRETAYLNAGDTEEARLKTMLAQSEVVSKDPAVIELVTNYQESEEVILLDSLEDDPNESRDDWITEDGSRGKIQLDLESVSNLDNSFCKGDFSKPGSSPSSESSEDVQFHFTDLDDLRISKKTSIDGNSQDRVNDEKANLCSENFDQDSSPANSDDANNRTASAPINIARISDAVNNDEKFGRFAESMPAIRSQIENLDPYLIHVPLSQSLDTDSTMLSISSPCKEDETPVKSGEQLDEEQLNSSGDEQILEEAGNVPLRPEIEVSLCRHMLYEGMGAEAAAQAFESKKLDRDKFIALCPVVMGDDRLVVRIQGRYFPWESAAPIFLGMVSFGSKLVTEPKGLIVVEKKEERAIEEDSSRVMSPSNGSWRLWPFSFKRSHSGKVMQDTGTSSADETEGSPEISHNSNKVVLKQKSVKKMVRSVTPTSEQLASLNLKEGSNSVTFTFSTAMLGDQQVDARIYLWKWNTRIIISDVDGTITKSDVLGQFMPLVGMDWAQTGVAHLFSAIKENGYQLLFLSARAISQAYHTRRFLFNLKQDGKGLPDGPVVISPDGLFPSLYREVIRRAPHEFKIACLEEIKALFPPDYNPFYAGFGNRNTDEISYLKVGIPKGKIFTINPKGEVVVNKHINTKSYSSLHALVHGMFPPTAKSEPEAFNQWNYWKLPPPDIDI